MAIHNRGGLFINLSWSKSDPPYSSFEGTAHTKGRTTISAVVPAVPSYTQIHP